MKKLNWIADYLHHTIAVTDLEKAIISSEIFNRLHNILQNSTVYFTYPSNRTSRFSHSLGCMELSGGIFRFSFTNSNKVARDEFLRIASNEIEAIEQSEEFIRVSRELLKTANNIDALQAQNDSALDHPVLVSALPGHDFSTRQRYAYKMLSQATRLTALLHDLGHPPFSHISESAIDGILESLPADGLTPRQQNFQDIVEKNRTDSKKFHEQLGLTLAKFLLQDVVGAIKELNSHAKNFKLIYDYLVISFLTLRILKEDIDTADANFFRAIHRIVDSNLDSDRLDYVPRDLGMSGISREPLRYDRLIASFELVYIASERYFEFVPSIRALSTIEDFFTQRFKLYKYVIFHHRVAKTDGLLRQSIIDLATDYLSQRTKLKVELDSGEAVETAAAKGSLSQHLLPSDISGLWEVLNPKKTNLRDILINNYTQWDDAWLLSILRKHYFELKLGLSGSTTKKKRVLLARLSEFLSNKKNYYSLFKRSESFSVVDDAFVDSIPDTFSWESLAESLGMLKAMQEVLSSRQENFENMSRDGDLGKAVTLVLLIEHFKAYRDAKAKNDQFELARLQERRGFFVVNLQELLTKAGSLGTHGNLFVKDALKLFVRKAQLTDAILIPKQIPPGIRNDHSISTDGGIRKLGEVSRIADELKRAARQFPPFYVYVFREKDTNIKPEELPKMRRLLGQLLWHSFERRMIQTRET